MYIAIEKGTGSGEKENMVMKYGDTVVLQVWLKNPVNSVQVEPIFIIILKNIFSLSHTRYSEIF